MSNCISITLTQNEHPQPSSFWLGFDRHEKILYGVTIIRGANLRLEFKFLKLDIFIGKYGVIKRITPLDVVPNDFQPYQFWCTRLSEGGRFIGFAISQTRRFGGTSVSVKFGGTSVVYFMFYLLDLETGKLTRTTSETVIS